MLVPLNIRQRNEAYTVLTWSPVQSVVVAVMVFMKLVATVVCALLVTVAVDPVTVALALRMVMVL